MSISLSKWPMLPRIAWCFIRCMCSTPTMSLLPVVVMTMSARSIGLLDRGHLEAVHQRLQRADRVDLGDDHPGALAAQRLGGALADVAVADDQRDLAADQHVGAAVDPVDQRVPDAVLVVELALGDRVVDVDRREQQFTGGGQLVEPVDAGGGLLGDAADVGRGARPVLRVVGQRRAQQVEDDRVLLGVIVLGSAGRRRPSRTARPCGSAGSRRRRRRGSCSGPGRPASAASGRCTTSTPAASRPSRRRPARRTAPRRVPYGPTTTAAAAWSWVEKMLQDAQRTSAPSATSVSMSTAVCTVMCSEPEIRAPASGRTSAYSRRSAIRPGISCSARVISLRPKSARARSATLKSRSPTRSTVSVVAGRVEADNSAPHRAAGGAAGCGRESRTRDPPCTGRPIGACMSAVRIPVGADRRRICRCPRS